MKYAHALTAVALIVTGGLALAQSHHGEHMPMKEGGHTMTPAAKESPATEAYRAANAKMHAGMDIAFTGDADVDFIKGMIPHHQGAIDMAEVVLKHGKDEKTRKWAIDIIREQKREIAEMQAWLKTRKAD
jgi:uncharacterized protein (DUF305 family)